MARKKSLEARVFEAMERIAFPEAYVWECAPKVSEQIKAMEILCKLANIGEQTQEVQRHLYVHVLAKTGGEKQHE